MPRMRGFLTDRKALARVFAGGIVGVVFLLSAVGKAGDIGLFTRQIRQLIPWVESDGLIRFLALETILFETLLAAALLSGATYRGWTYVATIASLIFFSILLGIAAVFGKIEDCGCFGALLEMNPRAALLKNALLVVLTGVAWAAGPPRYAAPLSGRTLTKLAFGIGPFILMIGFLAHGVSTTAAMDLDAVRRPYAKFRFEIDGVRYDLGKGEHFVALLSTGCGACVLQVPALNELPTKYPDMPPVIALCVGTDEMLERFREKMKPEFPLTLIPPEDFLRLIGRVTPRFVYVRDGAPMQIWDSLIPDPPPSRIHQRPNFKTGDVRVQPTARSEGAKDAKHAPPQF